MLIADLEAAGFDYWALGHIHKSSVSQGRCTVVMPGMPQGRDINEAGPKSVTLVTVGNDRAVHVEERTTSVAEFARIFVDATAFVNWADLVAAAGAALEQARKGANSEHLVARVQLAGATPLAWRARRDHDVLKADIDLRVSTLGKCWIEKLEIECHPPSTTVGSSADPRAELRRLVAEDILRSDGFKAEARMIAAGFHASAAGISRAFRSRRGGL